MKVKFSTLKPLITLVLCTTLFSCGNNPLDIDISNVKVDLKVKRFDQDLFDYEKEITQKDVEELNKKYQLFFQDYTEGVINIGSVKNPTINHQLNAFVNDSYIKEIKTDVNKIYADFSLYQNQLEDAFKHYKYYFPNKLIPEIVTYISGFNYAITTDNKTYLGIGLDMFLGSSYDAYSQLGLPQYKIKYMTKENLVTGAILGWVSTEFELKETNANLLTEMIHQGKILFLLDALMPDGPNTIKVSYTEKQIQWCENNEQHVWFYFIDNELLYTKETTEIIKYMGESPFIQGFPEGSPGRIGHWVGWQIVKAYMKQNPSISLEQLMEETDTQKILTDSKYKP
jgi:gliding motility-associated lipoprotein GldB